LLHEHAQAAAAEAHGRRCVTAHAQHAAQAEGQAQGTSAARPKENRPLSRFCWVRLVLQRIDGVVGIVPDKAKDPPFLYAPEAVFAAQPEGEKLIEIVSVEFAQAVPRFFAAILNRHVVMSVPVILPASGPKNVSPGHRFKVGQMPMYQVAKLLMAEAAPTPLLMI
jgi:hypothetical protein